MSIFEGDIFGGARRGKHGPALGAPVEPTAAEAAPTMAHQEGDGLLPSEGKAPEPRWLPWLLIGGGVLAASGIVLAATRRPVRANPRRRRRRRRTTR